MELFGGLRPRNKHIKSIYTLAHSHMEKTLWFKFSLCLGNCCLFDKMNYCREVTVLLKDFVINLSICQFFFGERVSLISKFIVEINFVVEWKNFWGILIMRCFHVQILTIKSRPFTSATLEVVFSLSVSIFFLKKYISIHKHQGNTISVQSLHIK